MVFKAPKRHRRIPPEYQEPSIDQQQVIQRNKAHKIQMIVSYQKNNRLENDMYWWMETAETFNRLHPPNMYRTGIMKSNRYINLIEEVLIFAAAAFEGLKIPKNI